MVLALSLLLGAQGAYSQSIKGGLKQFVKQINKQIEDKLEGQQPQKSQQPQKQQQPQKPQETGRSENKVTKPSAPVVAESRSESEAGQAATVRLPEQHTALFAPLGYPVEAQYGVKTAKPSMPPREPSKQVDWVGKQPNIFELDNQSLVDTYLLLNDCFDDGYIELWSPAHSHLDNVKEELWARAGVLNDLVEQYNEAHDEYGMEDTPQWVVDGIHDKIGTILDGRSYKTVIKSSLVPIFTMRGTFIKDETKAYFAAHGGYENAVNVNWTKWDPRPVKMGISTSVPGQTGKVLDEVAAGATVDVDGVAYVLHNDGYHAFASEAVNTAVAGKDMVMPDYIMYKGKKYSVKTMRGDLFSGTTIKSVKLPGTLIEISNSAFRGTPITEIVIPASVKRVQGSAFYNCSNLSKVVFEGDVIDEIGGCFQNCTALQSIKFPRRINERMSYDMFSGCTNLTEVTLPENITEIPQSMFEGCKKLTTVSIPAGVKKIGSQAFSGSGIVSLDIRNVTEFDGFCFLNCKNLKTVKLNSSLKDDFLMEVYDEFMGCPLLEVKYVNNQYVFPEGLIFVDGE